LELLSGSDGGPLPLSQRAAGLRAARRLVTGLVGRELRREGLPPATFGSLRPQELILAKTADRGVLGCMNDMAFACEVAISDAGGLAHLDPGGLNQALHRNINSSRGYRPPVELAAQQLERRQSSGHETIQEQAPSS
jgi:hypothetical protein